MDILSISFLGILQQVYHALPKLYQDTSVQLSYLNRLIYAVPCIV